MYKDHNFEEIDAILNKAQEAFYFYKKISLQERANFMRAIAIAIEELGEELISVAHKETHLSEDRLRSERKRTIFQLNSYADVAEKGDWLAIKIDTEIANTGQADLRKTLVPLGVVAVFGASNFPFAYSTAGGDTACALAAGCPVVVKAHPAHIETSTLVASAISSAVVKCGLPVGVFTHVYGNDFKVGEYLVKHDLIAAVGFTGSFSGGKALFDLANQRSKPIPVFAEMGSVNPVFILPEKLATEGEWLAEKLAKSITQDMGQFCTNPGVIVAVKGNDLANYTKILCDKLATVLPSKMLHKGIARNYINNMQLAITQRHVEVVYQSYNKVGDEDGMITIAKVPAKYFMANKKLLEEVFGPYSILVMCNNEEELLTVAQKLQGQLTCTLMATANDLLANENLVNTLQDKCGRLVFNNVPTGVAVALAMQHGGPFPSSTDSRFTAVGADGIKRFARPVSFQNCPDEFLPKELRNNNEQEIWRTINGQLTQESIH